VTAQVPGGKSANEYTPSLPEMVERMPLPSTRLAVTVACATGNLAALVTIPTIVPGAEESAAWTAGSANPMASTASKQLRR
jgi:hypothetical protein